MPDRDPNIAIVELAAFRLGPLLSEVVFTGGSTVGLLITDPGATYIRPTKDVDVITEVSAIYGYYQVSDKLRDLGFKEDSSDGAPLCRWVNNGLILDVMPTDPDILGFSNRFGTLSLLDTPRNRRCRQATRFNAPLRPTSWRPSWRHSMVGVITTTCLAMTLKTW